MAKKRLSSAVRKEKILQAARLIFSERGFHGATTRELARAASVSEALLFRHFPSKEAIYSAMFKACMKSETGSKAMKLLDLKPSTSTLATILHFILVKSIKGDKDMRITHKMMLRSLGEDGDFSRVLYKHVASVWIPKFKACLRAAQRAGDIVPGREGLANGAWLAQHLSLMVALMHTPTERVVRYDSSDEKLVADTVVFCLRGLGISDDVIAHSYNPAAFDLLAEA